MVPVCFYNNSFCIKNCTVDCRAVCDKINLI
jgi:hypothetical protein